MKNSESRRKTGKNKKFTKTGRNELTKQEDVGIISNENKALEAKEGEKENVYGKSRRERKPGKRVAPF